MSMGGTNRGVLAHALADAGVQAGGAAELVAEDAGVACGGRVVARPAGELEFKGFRVLLRVEHIVTAHRVNYALRRTGYHSGQNLIVVMASVPSRSDL